MEAGTAAGMAAATAAAMAAAMVVAIAATMPKRKPRQRQRSCQERDAKTASDADGDSDGLAPNELGKLNGVLHASPNAIAHASANSPIGTAREFGEALAGFLDSAETEDAPEGEGDEVADDEPDAVTVDDLAKMMAHMTNKPVTADQVQAVAERVGIETTDEAPEDEARG